MKNHGLIILRTKPDNNQTFPLNQYYTSQGLPQTGPPFPNTNPTIFLEAQALEPRSLCCWRAKAQPSRVLPPGLQRFGAAICLAWDTCCPGFVPPHCGLQGASLGCVKAAPPSPAAPQAPRLPTCPMNKAAKSCHL